MKHQPCFCRLLLCALFLCLAMYCGQASAAEDSAVSTGKCTIVSGNHTYSPSDCLIKKGMDENLSWLIIEKKDGRPLLEEILLISVTEIDPGTAEVSGLTKDGINSRWGEARFDGKCWSGDDFRICTD